MFPTFIGQHACHGDNSKSPHKDGERGCDDDTHDNDNGDQKVSLTYRRSEQPRGNKRRLLISDLAQQADAKKAMRVNAESDDHQRMNDSSTTAPTIKPMSNALRNFFDALHKSNTLAKR